MIVNKGDSFDLSFLIYDQEGEEYTPTTARYRIKCITTGRSIRSNTDLEAAQEIEIEVESDDNAIISDQNRAELRQLVLEIDYDTASQKVRTFEWNVRNVA
jgi:hypothetical protein